MLINPGFGLIFWMTVIFGVLLFILAKFAWKPIAKALHERENSIEDALASAEKAREEMKSLQANNEQLLQEARVERNKLLLAAKEQKESLLEDAKREALEEKKKIMDQTRKEIVNEKDKALSELKSSIAAFSLEISEKILKEQLKDNKKQKDLADKYLKVLRYAHFENSHLH